MYNWNLVRYTQFNFSLDQPILLYSWTTLQYKILSILKIQICDGKIVFL